MNVVKFLAQLKIKFPEETNNIDSAIDELVGNVNEASAPFEVLAEDSRMVTLPIPNHRSGIWKYYLDARRMFWVPEEITLSQDKLDWKNKLNADERFFVSRQLALFSSFDGIVNVNLRDRFLNEIDILEAKYFYNYQVMIEDIHAHTYALQLEALIVDIAERQRLLDAVKNIPVIAHMADFMQRCIESNAPLGERLFRMACVEGIFFTGAFVVIYWLTNRKLMPGLGQPNDLISKDEGLHTMFAMYMYTLLTPDHKISYQVMCEILTEAVNLAKEFMRDSIPNPMQGMNSGLICDYIESQGDNLLTLLELPKLYNATHSFKFMEQINVENKTNFFERRVSEYSKANSADTVENERVEDF